MKHTDKHLEEEEEKKTQHHNLTSSCEGCDLAFSSLSRLGFLGVNEVLTFGPTDFSLSSYCPLGLDLFFFFSSLFFLSGEIIREIGVLSQSSALFKLTFPPPPYTHLRLALARRGKP